MPKGDPKLDVVLVVGPMGRVVNREVSRITRKLRRSLNDCHVASIHFQFKYDAKLGKQELFGSVSDLSNVGGRRPKSQDKLVQGNPLGLVAGLRFRNDATRICFLISNSLPFLDSWDDTITHGNDLNENSENIQTTDGVNGTVNGNTVNGTTTTAENTETTASNPKTVHQSDPLQTCHLLATMGVVLYCIEINSYSNINNDMFEAFAYITGGKYINTMTSQLSKVVRYAMLEEATLESFNSYVRDYLCIAWLTWGRRKATKPSGIDELSANLLNYLQDINIQAPELLMGGKSLRPPGKHARKIAALAEVSEARRMVISEDNWRAELSWLAVEICNEVIPGYVKTLSAKEAKHITVSGLKRLTWNQAERILVRTLARRPGMIRKQLEEQTIQEREIPEKRESGETEKALVANESVTQKKENLKDTSCQGQLILSCKQDLLVTEKNNFGQKQMFCLKV